MAVRQLPIDFKVLRVLAYRYKWILVVFTFVSIAFSTTVVLSLINLYDASITMFVDPENLISRVVGDVAVTTSLQDQLTSLHQQVLSDDFIEPHVIQELGLRFEDVYIPPLRLKFMPDVLEIVDALKDFIKKIFGLPLYLQSEQQQQYMKQKEIIRILKKNIDITQSRGMLLIISYSGRSPTTSSRIVEILANQCKELLLRNKNQEAREALRYIEREYNDVTQQLEQFESDMAKMRLADFEKGVEAKMALMQQRQQALDSVWEIQQDRDALSAKRQELMTEKDKRKTTLMSDADIMSKLARISQNKDAVELELLEKRLAELREVYTDEWPEVQSLQDKITDLRVKMQTTLFEGRDPEAEERVLMVDPLYSEYARQLIQSNAEEAALAKKEKKLNDLVTMYESKLRAMTETETRLSQLERQIRFNEKRQLDLAEKRQTAQSTKQLQELRQDQIRTVARSFPIIPTGPSSMVIMIILCLLGPAAGAGIVFLLYYLNNSVKSVEDVQKEYNLPVVAIIPKTNFKRELRRHRKFLKRSPTKSSHEATVQLALQKIDDPEIELFKRPMKRVSPEGGVFVEGLHTVTMLTNPESPAAEEYRRLCFNVEWGLKESLTGPCKTIMITSALPNEGKTITAVNLASTLARNHKVLLIDANLRKPAIHHIFGLSERAGLSDLIAKKITPDLYAIRGCPQLSILTAGLTLEAPADLLSSQQMSAFIESVKNSSYFEYAIVDVPPVSLIPDSSIIASKLDGIVWVIQELRTSKEIVRMALTRITNPAILGVVLNGSEQRRLPKKYENVLQEYQKISILRRENKT